MKQKQEKERKVTAHSTIAAVSGPRPDVKVKKHFENAWREKNKTDRPTLSKPIDSLPCICEEQEEEPVVPQKPKFKAKPQDDRKKCYRPKLQSSFQKPKLSGPNQKSNKSTGERLSKRSVEINVMLPAVTTDADNSSSSSAVEEKKTNTPVNSPSEIQLDMQNKIINDTLSELEHLYSTKQTNQSEVDMLYSDKPCYPNHSVIAEGDYNPITWTPSMVCTLLNKPYEQKLLRDLPKIESESSPGSQIFSTCTLIDHQNPTRDVASSSDAHNRFANSINEISSKSFLKDRSTQIQEIQMELTRWREKLKEKQKEPVHKTKPLSINTLSVQTFSEQMKQISDKSAVGPLLEVEEPSHPGYGSSGGQQSSQSTPTPQPQSPETSVSVEDSHEAHGSQAVDMQNATHNGRKEIKSIYGNKGAIRKSPSKRSHRSSRMESKRISNKERSSSKPKNITRMNSFSKIANEPLNVEMPIFQQEDSTTALLKADTLLRTTQRQLIDVQLAFQETKCDPLKNLETTPTSGNDPPLKRELITTTIKGGVSDYKALLLSGPMMSNKNEQIAIDEEENRNKNKNFVSPAEGMKVDKESSGTVTYLDCQYNRALQQEMFNTRANVEGALTTAKNLSSLLTDGLIKDLYMHNPDKPFKKQTNDTCTYQKDYLKNTMQAKDKFNIPDYELNTTLTVKGKITEDIPTNDQNNDEDKVFRNCDQINPMPMFSENICYCSNCTSAPTSDVKPVAHTTPGYCNCINSRRNTVTQARIMHKKLHLADQKTSREHEDNTTKTHCTCNKDRSNFKKQTKSNCNCIKAYSSEKSATELQEKCACMRVCTCGESMHFSKCSNSAVIHVKTCSESEEIMTQEEIHIGKKLISQVLPSVSIKRDLSVQKIPSVRIPPPGATPYVSANKNVSLWGVSHSQIELDLWDCPSNSQANKERMICQEKSSASKCSCTQTVMRKKKAGKCNLVFETMPAIDLDNGLCAECNAYLSKQELKTGHCISCKNKGQGILSENKIYQEGSYEAGQSNIGNVEQLAAKCIRCLKACNINELYCGLCKICFNVSVHEEITKFCLTSPTPDMIKAAAHLGQCDECHRYFPESELFQGHCIMCQITKKEVRLYQCNLCLNSVPSTEYFEGKCVRCYRMIVYDNSRAATSSKGLAVVQQNVNSVFDGTPFLFDLNVAQGINRIVCSDKNMSRKEENCSTYSRVPTGKEKGKVGKSVMETTKGNLTKGQLMIETNLSSNGDESDDGNENNFESSQMDENLTYKAWLMKRESEGKCDLNESIDLKNDADSDISIDSDSTSKPESVLGWVNSKERQSSIGNDALLSESKRSKRSSKVRYLIDTGASQSDSDTSITKTNLNSGTSSVSVQFVNSKPQIIGEQDIVRSVHIDKSRELKDDESNDSDYEKYLFEKRNAFKRRATPYFGKKEAERLSELMASIIQISNEELQDTSEKNERNPELNEMESNRLSVAIGDVLVSENTSFSDENNDTHPQLNNQTKTEINSKATLNSEYQKNKVRYGSKLNNYKHNESNIKTNSFSQNINEIKPEPKLTLMVKVKPNRAMFEEGSLQEIFQHSQNDQQHNSDRNKIAVRGGERIVREQETQTTSRQAVGSQTTPLFMPQTLEKLTLSEAHRSSSGVMLRDKISKYNPSSMHRLRATNSEMKESNNFSLSNVSTTGKEDDVGKRKKNINIAEYPIEQYIIMQDIEDDSVTSETDAKVEEAAATDDKTSVTEGDDIYEDDWEEEPEKKDTGTEDENNEKYDIAPESEVYKTVEHSKEPYDDTVSSSSPKPKSSAEHLEEQTSPMAKDPSTSPKNKINCPCNGRKKVKASKVEGENPQLLSAPKMSDKLPRKKRQSNKTDSSDVSTRRKLSGESNKITTQTVQNQNTMKYSEAIYPGKTVNESQEKSEKRIADKSRNTRMKNKENVKEPSDFYPKEDDSASISPRSLDIPNAEKEINLDPSFESNDTIKCPVDIPNKLMDKETLLISKIKALKCPDDLVCTKKEIIPSSGNKVVKCPIDIPCSEEDSLPLDAPTKKGVKHSTQRQTTKCSSNEPCKNKDHSFSSKRQASKVAKCPIEVTCSGEISIPLDEQTENKIAPPVVDVSTSPIRIPLVDRATSLTLGIGKSLMDRETSPIDIPQLEASTSPMSLPEMVDKQISSANILNFTDKETSTMSQPEMIDRQTSANFEEVYPINTQLSLQSSDECVCEDAVAGNICLPEDVNEQKMLMTCVPSDSSDDKDVSSVEMQIGKDFPCKSKCSRDCARGSEFVSRCMSVVKRMNVRTSSQQISEKIKESGNMDSKNKILRRKMQEFSTDTVGSFYSSSEDATGDLDSHMKLIPSEGELVISCSVCSVGELAATNNSMKDLSDNNMKSSGTFPISVGEVWSCQCIDNCLCSEGEIVSEHREQFEIRSCSQQISSLQERATLETCTTSSREEDDGSSSQDLYKSKDKKNRQQKFDYICTDCGTRCWSNSSSEGEKEDTTEDLSIGQIRSSNQH